MSKTASHIVSEVIRNIVEGSSLHLAVTGRIYEFGTRPLNSETEDIVVGFLAGLDGQWQEGVININIFIPDIDNGTGAKVKNATRCAIIEELAQGMVDRIRPTGEYLFRLETMIQSYAVHEGAQHFVNVRLKFRRENLKK